MIYNRKNPFYTHLTRKYSLSKEGSEKRTEHFEFHFPNDEITYECGDSLAIFPKNCPNLVNEIINTLSLSGEEIVLTPNKEEVSLRKALTESYHITKPDKKFLANIIEKGVKDSEITEILESKDRGKLEDYLWGKEIIDYLLKYKELKYEASEFVSILKKLQPRLYSIASSHNYSKDEVHLTIAIVTYNSFDRERKGVCTTYLADRLEDGEKIPVFITPGRGFRLPEPTDQTPIIMIGPGTGIAPFRAFLQDRNVTNAKVKSWLFFGEQREKKDFHYKAEFEKYLEDGTLTKLTTAFSRDQDYKIYVQHRLLENAKEIYDWLEDGAIIYICGDASRMAKDVDNALKEIVQKEGNKTIEEAEAYVKALSKDKRYRKDVY